MFVALGTIDPNQTLTDVLGWAKLVLIIAILLGVIKGGRKHGDGDTKGAVSTLVAVIVVAVAGAIALNPFGVGTSILNIFA